LEIDCLEQCLTTDFASNWEVDGVNTAVTSDGIEETNFLVQGV
jgi:hypothetical protein